MNKEVFIKNREKLIKNIEDNSIIILFAGSAPTKAGDEKYEFTPNRNFYYFTGIDEECHILLIKKIKGNVEETLFIKDIDEEKERWVGRGLRDSEATELSGIDDIKYLSGFNNQLNSTFNKFTEISLYLDLKRDDFDSIDRIEDYYSKLIKEKYPFVIIKNIYNNIVPLRLVKSKEEVYNIRKAIDITISGVKAIMNNLKPEMKEYESEAFFEFSCKCNGAKDYAFKTIAAAGKNATILHYVDNNSTIKDGDLILFDLGAQYNYYNADITRTFPVNGKFTERQKQVYESVLKVNLKVIDIIKPGVKFLEVNKLAREWVANECINLGLISKVEEVNKYYWHGIGHSLGLETHDIDSLEHDTVFSEGMVWTVEPGIYIEEEGIGIRIEDDILVTKDGVEVLTKGMIKTTREIEEYMKRRL